jgi:hypothetical protein
LTREAQESPQPVGVLLGDGPLSQLGFHIPRELPQYLAEGQVGVTDPGLGIALPDGHDQVSMLLLGTTSELGDQGCFATAGLAHHEAHLALASQGTVEKTIELP